VEKGNPATAAKGDTVPGRVRADLIGALGLMALGVGALVVQRARSHGARRRPDDKRWNLAAYLHDHLSGADAAIQVVGRLRRQCEGTHEGSLFAWLDEEFRQDRNTVLAILSALGASSWSLKRLAGRAAGDVLKTAAGGKPGELTLLRTLEGLAVGVQGKGCLWRVAQELEPSLQVGGERSFTELESRAVVQWGRIEQYRLDLARHTFGV
jgi:hypothetical protein